MLKYLMAYNNHEYGSKGIYRQHMECLNTSCQHMLKYLVAYNNHEYGSKSTYRQHMECLNTSWLTTIMSTAARVSIVNTWNA